ncbi:serine carboxypeptidase S28-domain-containing protein [Hyaloraphidium curvatum]|nr:serine carboxypeptidase S28-domain-containing protein [Hyaloraphidium curvatum]
MSRATAQIGAIALLLSALLCLAGGAAALDTPNRPPLPLPGDPALPQPYLDANCTVFNFTQRIDHFNARDERTFAQRVYVCDAYFPRDPAAAAKQGNLLVFLGNETPLNSITQPIVFENLQRMRALLVEVEHRYYGTSFPFSVNSTTGALETPQFKYLTMEQVMADTKAVVEAMRRSRAVPNRVPSLVIGGSYGGQIALYHRLTYPETFQAAIAASAPVDYVLGTKLLAETENNFHVVLRRAYTTMGTAACAATIRAGMDAIAASRNADSETRKALARDLGLCGADAVLDDPATVQPLLGFFYDGFVTPAQLNDQTPYPGYIMNICKALNDSLVAKPGNFPAALQAAYRLQNGSAPTDCLNFVPRDVVLPPAKADPMWPSYNYQMCAQGAINSGELSSNGSSAVLLPIYTLTTEDIRADCLRYFGPQLPPLTPLPAALDFRQMLAKTGAVVFTNGDMDHWSGGSIEQPIPGVKMATIVYPNASHCTDTHSYNWNNTAEPPIYKELRAKAIDTAAAWMEDYRGAPSGVASLRAGWAGALVAAAIALLFTRL